MRKKFVTKVQTFFFRLMSRMVSKLLSIYRIDNQINFSLISVPNLLGIYYIRPFVNYSVKIC